MLHSQGCNCSRIAQTNVLKHVVSFQQLQIQSNKMTVLRASRTNMEKVGSYPALVPQFSNRSKKRLKLHQLHTCKLVQPGSGCLLSQLHRLAIAL